MTKLINKQNLNYEIYLNQVPISSQLNLYLKKNKLNKLNYIHFGDDYQILFTASPKNRKIIKSVALKINQKITIIGKILSGKGISKGENIGTVYKYTPPDFYNNTPDKWFVTNGAEIKASNRPEQILKCTTRHEEEENNFGIVGGILEKGELKHQGSFDELIKINENFRANAKS